MAEFEECRAVLKGAWKQTAEQIFLTGAEAEASAHQATEGLLRDLPSDKYPLRCALFVLNLSMVKSDAPNLICRSCEAVLGAQEDSKFIHLVDSLLKMSIEQLEAVHEQSRVWVSLAEWASRLAEGGAASPSTLSNLVRYVCLLERTPFDTVVVDAAQQLRDALDRVMEWKFLARRVDMLLMRHTFDV